MLPWGTRRGIWARRMAGRRQLPVLVWSWAYFHRHATVVQIGAHAGNDLLGHVFDKRPHWRGVLVEPVNFERLVARRGGDPRFELVRAAITDHNGTTRMHLIVD